MAASGSHCLAAVSLASRTRTATTRTLALSTTAGLLPGVVGTTRTNRPAMQTAPKTLTVPTTTCAPSTTATRSMAASGRLTRAARSTVAMRLPARAVISVCKESASPTAAVPTSPRPRPSATTATHAPWTSAPRRRAAVSTSESDGLGARSLLPVSVRHSFRRVSRDRRRRRGHGRRSPHPGLIPSWLHLSSARHAALLWRDGVHREG